MVQASNGTAEVVKSLRRGILHPGDFGLQLLLSAEGMLLDPIQDISGFGVYIVR